MPVEIMGGLLHLIRARSSARWPFDPGRPVRSGDLRLILEAGRWAPTAHNMQNFEVIVVDDPERIKRIGRIRTRTSENFILENYWQLSFSKEELMAKKTGILASGFPPSWTSKEVGEGRAPQEDREGTLADRLAGAPVLLIVVTDPSRRAPDSEGDRWGLMSLGCVMENMWLMAESLDLGFHVMVAFGEGAVEREMKLILGVPDHLRIAFGCRLGHPQVGSEPYFRVRREVDDFAHHNRYGQSYGHHGGKNHEN